MTCPAGHQTKGHQPMAEQLHFFDIPSPCVGICQLNEKGYCRGCYRSR
ncbi:DUF1289 domain-containing protein, partial [Morganella morganii]